MSSCYSSEVGVRAYGCMGWGLRSRAWGVGGRCCLGVAVDEVCCSAVSLHAPWLLGANMYNAYIQYNVCINSICIMYV